MIILQTPKCFGRKFRGGREKGGEKFGEVSKSHYLCTNYEKSRNEKKRNMENPFKFGTVVEEEYFTDRVTEVAYICQFIDSANHLILISPRRFGKSSVVAKAVKQSGRRCITVNLQQVP